MDSGVTQSFELQEACGMRLDGRNQGAEEIFRAKKAKVAKAWRKFYDLHGLCVQTDIIGMVE